MMRWKELIHCGDGNSEKKKIIYVNGDGPEISYSMPLYQMYAITLFMLQGKTSTALFGFIRILYMHFN